MKNHHNNLAIHPNLSKHISAPESDSEKSQYWLPTVDRSSNKTQKRIFSQSFKLDYMFAFEDSTAPDYSRSFPLFMKAASKLIMRQTIGC